MLLQPKSRTKVSCFHSYTGSHLSLRCHLYANSCSLAAMSNSSQQLPDQNPCDEDVSNQLDDLEVEELLLKLRMVELRRRRPVSPTLCLIKKPTAYCSCQRTPQSILPLRHTRGLRQPTLPRYPPYLLGEIVTIILTHAFARDGQDMCRNHVVIRRPHLTTQQATDLQLIRPRPVTERYRNLEVGSNAPRVTYHHHSHHLTSRSSWVTFASQAARSYGEEHVSEFHLNPRFMYQGIHVTSPQPPPETPPQDEQTASRLGHKGPGSRFLPPEMQEAQMAPGVMECAMKGTLDQNYDTVVPPEGPVAGEIPKRPWPQVAAEEGRATLVSASVLRTTAENRPVQHLVENARPTSSENSIAELSSESPIRTGCCDPLKSPSIVAHAIIDAQEAQVNFSKHPAASQEGSSEHVDPAIHGKNAEGSVSASSIPTLETEATTNLGLSIAAKRPDNASISSTRPRSASIASEDHPDSSKSSHSEWQPRGHEDATVDGERETISGFGETETCNCGKSRPSKDECRSASATS